MSKHKNTQTLGLFGTYAVLMKLTELGWTAIATPGNSKNTDIIAYKETGKQTICKRIEVKTTSNNFMWPKKKSKSPYGKHTFWAVGKIQERNLTDIIYCFVSIQKIDPEQIQNRNHKEALYYKHQDGAWNEILFHLTSGLEVQKYLKAADNIRKKYKRHSPNEYFRIGIPCGKGTNAPQNKLCGNWEILDK